MAKYNSRRSREEWLQLIIECRQSGLADNAWCEQNNIPPSSFYNAVTRLSTYDAQAIIPINWRNTKVPPEGIDFEGQLVCSMNQPYVYGGNLKSFIINEQW